MAAGHRGVFDDHVRRLRVAERHVAERPGLHQVAALNRRLRGRGRAGLRQLGLAATRKKKTAAAAITTATASTRSICRGFIETVISCFREKAGPASGRKGQRELWRFFACRQSRPLVAICEHAPAEPVKGSTANFVSDTSPIAFARSASAAAVS